MQGDYSSRRREGESNAVILDSVGVTRMCCRRMFITYVTTISTQQLAYPNKNVMLDRGGTTMLRHCGHVNVVSCD
tara:strand:- start:142 stop:366 length:225 start_codon:yes stop_codon:yes gene_type:complete